WYPGQIILNDDRYTVKDVNLLAERSRQAFLEYLPIGYTTDNPDKTRIYRSFKHGPLLDIFMLDERTYRGPNSPNNQPVPSKKTDFLSKIQVQWLKKQLLSSKATWKVIASDMPLGLIVTDGTTDFEAWANGNGPTLGRELELADLLRFIK
ncbi:MAG: alkaline phosphatase D family protein, partial [Nostoc sp.]